MLARLIYDVEIVKITAPNENDAFRLFETLNDRGLDLSAADLIKNKLFAQCGPTEIDDATNAWTHMLTLVRSDEVVNYLRAYWIAVHGFVRKRQLYDRYKEHITPLDATTAGLFSFELDEDAEYYQQMIDPNPEKCVWGRGVAEALQNLIAYRARSYRPAVLACAKFQPDNIAKIVDACEAISVRYSVVGEKNPNRLEELYAEICKALRNKAVTLEEAFSSAPLSQYLDEVPHDDEFVDTMAHRDVNSSSPAWRKILIRLNQHMATGGTNVEHDPQRVHVDHILPQKPRAAVLSESGVSTDEAIELIPRLGNLTLLHSKRNREASNKPFGQKRETFARSDIYMTRKLAELSRWGQPEIENRSMQLAQLASTVYRHPKQIFS